MANIVKLGSLLLDGILMRPGSQYQPGQDIEFGNGDNISWIVVNGLLIADRPLLVNISWTDLEQQDLISGKAVTINGQRFLSRLLKVGIQEGAQNEWDPALDMVGEENRLWHWKRIGFWGQESTSLPARVFRGYSSPRGWSSRSSGARDACIGFRPTLELLSSDNLVSENRVCTIGGQSILYGKLLDTTGYDAIILPESVSMMAELDDGNLYTKLPDGTVIIDRTQVVVQVIKGE